MPRKYKLGWSRLGFTEEYESMLRRHGEEYQEGLQRLAGRDYTWEDFGIDPTDPKQLLDQSRVEYVWHKNGGKRVAIPKKLYDEFAQEMAKKLREKEKKFK